MTSKEKKLDSSDARSRSSTKSEPTKTEDSPSSEPTQSSETDATTIDKGPYGVVAILSLDGNVLRSLGINPDHVDAIRYQPYNGAILVEPVTL